MKQDLKIAQPLFFFFLFFHLIFSFVFFVFLLFCEPFCEPSPRQKYDCFTHSSTHSLLYKTDNTQCICSLRENKRIKRKNKTKAFNSLNSNLISLIIGCCNAGQMANWYQFKSDVSNSTHKQCTIGLYLHKGNMGIWLKYCALNVYTVYNI